MARGSLRCCLGFAFAAALGLALASGARAQSGAQAELTQLMQLLAQVKSSSARFTEQKSMAVLSAPMTLSGRLNYVRGGRIEKITLVPFEERFSIEGDTLIVENKTRGQTQTLALREHPAAWAFVESFRAMLGGDLATLQRHYRVTLTGDLSAWSVELVPRDERMARQVESIRFRGSRSDVAGIEINETGGNRSVMTITPA